MYHASGRRASDLALLGGAAVFSGDWPPWPLASPATLEEIGRVLEGGRWALTSRSLGAISREREFATAFAQLIGAAHCVSTDHGSSSLLLTLEALDLTPGAEVIVPAHSWVATATAVVNANAIPVFADVDPRTGCLDPAAAAASISSRTECLITVHLYRSMSDVDALNRLSSARGLPLVEDCAQAHGAQWRGRCAGTFGVAGAFSFQQAKVLTAGEGGAVTTDDPVVYRRLVQLRTDGRFYRNVIEPAQMEVVDGGEVFGSNYCLTEIQAVMLLDQMTRFEQQSLLREKNAQYLDAELRSFGIDPIDVPSPVTRQSIYKYGIQWPEEGWEDVSIGTVCAALQAELGVPFHAADAPLYRHPLYRPWTKRRNAISADHVERLRKSAQTSLRGAEAFCKRLLLFHHPVLLAPHAQVHHVIEAVGKVLGQHVALRRLDEAFVSGRVERD